MFTKAKSWSEVIEQCTARLRFFQERLNYNASQSSGRQFLIDTYSKFIPKFVRDENDTTRVEVNTSAPKVEATPDSTATPNGAAPKSATSKKRRKIQ